MVTSAAERKAVAHLVADHGMSERQACKAIGCCHINVRYKTTRPDGGDLRDRMMAIAHERRRFGYKRLHVMLRREVFVVQIFPLAQRLMPKRKVSPKSSWQPLPRPRQS